MDRRGNSSAGIAAMLRSGREKNRSFISGRGKGYLFSGASRSNLQFTQPPIQEFFLGVKRTEPETLYSAMVINA
jgi:hypothetical protein